MFNARDLGLIKAIPLTSTPRPDILSWGYTKNGLFSVRTAYMLGMSIPLQPRNACWDLVWRSDIPPKIRHFLWKMVAGILPTRSLLAHRHIIEDATCPFCSMCPENISHTFFDCVQVQELWEGLISNQFIAELKEMEPADFLVELQRRLSAEMFQMSYVLLWQVWYRRNLLVHQSKSFPVTYWKQRVARTRDELCMAGAQEVRSSVSAGRRTWQWNPPTRSRMKLNSDAAFREDGSVQVGVAARDHSGAVLFTAAKSYNCQWSVPVAEAIGILYGLSLALDCGFLEVEVESDCLQVINCLKNGDDTRNYLGKLVDDIKLLADSFTNVTWCHTPRDGNALAHFLAKSIDIADEEIWMASFPQAAARHVFVDGLVIN